MLEDVFTFEGSRGHEISFVYDVEVAETLPDSRIPVADTGDDAVWMPVDAFAGGRPPLYPDGLYELVAPRAADQAAEPRGVVARRDGVVLRGARESDLTAVDRLTVTCYGPIQESYVAMLGDTCYETTRLETDLPWDARKTRQNRDLYPRAPDSLWVLDGGDDVFGFVSFRLFPERRYGHIDNNGVRPDRAGEGWATFIYRHVLEHFRALGLRCAHVDTGLDDAHTPARRAYEAVGFDRAVPTVDYWQDLSALNPGSVP